MLVLAVLLVAFNVNNGNTGSDSLGALLVSQTILTERTIRLDNQYAKDPEQFKRDYPYQVHRVGEHHYYSFPIGTSVFATPFVLVENALGRDMRDRASDAKAQVRITAVLCAFLALVLARIGRRFVPPPLAVAVSAVVVFGGPIISTLATALWSSCFAAVFIALVLREVVRAERVEGARIRPWWMGSLLFAAYLCRPTTAVFAVAAWAWAVWTDRRAAAWTAVWVAGWLALFCTLCFLEIGQPLPDYYSPGRLDGAWSSVSLAGVLISPSRGLLVYCPYVLLAVGIAAHGGTRRISALVGGWLLLHVLVVSRFPVWWGGACFGPRLFAEVFPGVAVLCFVGAEAVLKYPRRLARIGAAVAFLVLGIFSIHVHTWKATLDRETRLWNYEIPTEHRIEYLFDWKYPQFAYTEEMHKRRLGDYALRALPALLPPLRLSPAEPTAIFSEWYGLERGTTRWSKERGSEIIFRLGELDPDVAEYALALEGVAHGRQRVRIRVNGRRTSHQVHLNKEPVPVTRVPTRFLKPGELNVVRFRCPDARRAGPTDDRIIGIEIQGLTLRPAGAHQPWRTHTGEGAPDGQ
ncbi:MAG: hypothetical protein JRI25_08000 [Deltaproteobacteria bacterium]|nr:hypothetical protein [Deltaproteobacteria bacterium]